MNELERLAYLQAMGITNFMPRKQLPNAPTSQACAWHPLKWASVLAKELAVEWRLLDDSNNPLTSSSESSRSLDAISREENTTRTLSARPSSTSLTRSEVSSNRQSTTSVLVPNTPSNEEAKPQKPPKTDQSAINSTISEEVPRFALSVWRISEDWLVIDSRHSELALPTEVFLLNIIRALNLSSHSLSGLPNTQVFRWPMLKDPMQARRFGRGLNQNADAAKEALAGFLDEQLVLQPARYLWLMGEEAINYLLPQKIKNDIQSTESPRGYLTQPEVLEDWNISLFSSPSLSELIIQSEKKSEFWQQWQRWQYNNQVNTQKSQTS